MFATELACHPAAGRGGQVQGNGERSDIDRWMDGVPASWNRCVVWMTDR